MYREAAEGAGHRMSRRIDDPDWAPQVPSIWDEAEDDEAQDALWFDISSRSVF